MNSKMNWRPWVRRGRRDGSQRGKLNSKSPLSPAAFKDESSRAFLLIDHDDLGQGFPIRHEIHGHGIHAMACIFFRETFTHEYMSQVTATIGAEDFRASTIGIGLVHHRILDFFIKAGPAATGMKFCIGIV